jgi:amidase
VTQSHSIDDPGMSETASEAARLASVDLRDLTVDEVQQGFASGAYSSEELTRACLEQIARLDPHYNSIVALNPDALDDARAIDKRRAAGEALGPLAGVPVVIKDPMNMKGLPTFVER